MLSTNLGKNLKFFYICSIHDLNTGTMNIIITLLIGAVAGWLAGFFVVKDKGGLIWNILIGLAGGFVGGWLLGKLGATSPFWAQWYGQIVSAVIGAVILLAIWNFVKKAFK